MSRPKKFSSKSLATIKAANDLIRKYRRKGHLTLTQLYQLLVNSGEIEEGVRSYKRLQTLIAEGRECGIFHKDDIAGRYHGIDEGKLS